MNTQTQPSGGRARRHGSRESQRGFALLLVFALAAAVAITLYMQLPRVAFEAQRDREEMLIQRGEEYKRAIELYVRKNNRYPQNLDELERQQEVRYLRRRYKDPLTGDDEWRLIHINAAGQLEDSLIKKEKTGEETETATSDSSLSDENVAENTALARQRSGDQLAASAAFPGSGNENAGALPQGQGPQQPVNPLDHGLVPMLDASGNVIDRTRTEAQAQAQQGVQPGQIFDPNNPNAPAGIPPPNNSANGSIAQSQPRLGPGGIPIIENPNAVVAQEQNPGSRQTPGAPPIAGAPSRGASNQQGSGSQQGGQRSAQEMLQGLLTTPVPGGLQGLQQRRGIQPTGGSSQGLGAGIAGVASKFEMRGIKVYDEQESIHKWEFVFDARSSTAQGAQQGGRSFQGQQGVGTGQSGFGQSGFGQGTGGSNRNDPNRNPRGTAPSFGAPGQQFGAPPGSPAPSPPRRQR